MSFATIFGKKKEIPPTVSEALQKLSDTEELLIKKQAFLETKIDAELQTAKKYGTANKRLALKALKRRKEYSKQLDNIDGVLCTLHNQKQSLESAAMNIEILKVLSDSAKAFAAANKDMSVEKVEDLMEEISEGQELSNAIAEAISKPVSQMDEDEDELLAELMALEEEQLENELLNVEPIPFDVSKLPAVPTNKLSKSKEENVEISDLLAWAES